MSLIPGLVYWGYSGAHCRTIGGRTSCDDQQDHQEGSKVFSSIHQLRATLPSSSTIGFNTTEGPVNTYSLFDSHLECASLQVLSLATETGCKIKRLWNCEPSNLLTRRWCKSWRICAWWKPAKVSDMLRCRNLSSSPTVMHMINYWNC